MTPSSSFRLSAFHLSRTFSHSLFISLFPSLALSIPLSLSPIEVLSWHGVRARCVMTHRGELVELSEELVQQLHQLLSRALRRQTGEAHDVGEQDAAGATRKGKRGKEF